MNTFSGWFDDGNSSDEDKKKPKKGSKKALDAFNGYDSSSNSSEEEERNTKKYKQKASYDCNKDKMSSSSSSSSDDERESKRFLAPVTEAKLGDDWVQTVAYNFTVKTNSKTGTKPLVISGDGIEISSATRCTDFPSSKRPNINSKHYNLNGKKMERVSENSDIILEMSMDLETSYPGDVKVEFPSVSCPNNTVSYQSNPYITKLIQPSLDTKTTYHKQKGTSLIKRELTSDMIQFLQDYPGQTADNCDVRAVKSINSKKSKMVVSREPASCLIHFLEQCKDISSNQKESIFRNTVNDGRAIELTSEMYKTVVQKARYELKKDFAFSDITSDKFSIIITPVLDVSTKKEIAQHTQRLERDKTLGATEKQNQLAVLHAPCFTNFLNIKSSFSSDTVDKEFEKFNTTKQEFVFKGTIYVKYIQVQQASYAKKK